VTRHIQERDRARKRAPGTVKAARRSAMGARLAWVSLAILGVAGLLPRCSAQTVDYGVGNDLQGRTPPLAPGVTLSDATVIPPGILDANCGGPACSVSWTTDIFPNMEAVGPWQCASPSCHGGGATLPPINDGDPSGAYGALATFAGITPPYIVPCNTNSSACSILCNLTAGGCGTTMPIGTGTPLTTTDLAMIQTWIKCGSPLN